MKSLRRAAERHLADAQYELGDAHFTGYGGAMPRSVADGLDWLRRAAAWTRSDGPETSSR